MALRKEKTSAEKRSRWPKIKRKRISPQTNASVTSKTKETPNRVVARLSYDMILYWLTARRPMMTQKLAFNAGPTLDDAYTEAKKIRTLLMTAGNFKEQEVSLVAVSQTNALEKHFSDHRIFTSAKKAEMTAMVKSIKDMKLGKKTSAKNDDEPIKGSVKTRGSSANKSKGNKK
jgi:hypothetical protein